MKHHVRFAVVAALALFAALPARAQDTSSKKPGGINKVARDVSKTVKKAGSDTKAEVKRGASTTHGALKEAGNETKTVLKKTTGIHGSESNQPGGLNKVARDISKASKKTASEAKTKKNRVKSKAHATATTTGKEIKEIPKKP
jgi:hypothetical protein